MDVVRKFYLATGYQRHVLKTVLLKELQ